MRSSLPAFGLALVVFVTSGVARAQLGLPLDAIFRDYARPDPARPGVRVIDLDRGDVPVYAREPILNAASTSAAEATSLVSNRTGLSSDPQHGTQISFATRDGKAYLWYPGNQVVLQGEWRTDTRRVEIKLQGQLVKVRNESSVCYRYGANTFNPATRQAGAWNCLPVLPGRSFFRESRTGDVFGLSKNSSPPFVLSREAATIAALLTRISGRKKTGELSPMFMKLTAWTPKTGKRSND